MASARSTDVVCVATRITIRCTRGPTPQPAGNRATARGWQASLTLPTVFDTTKAVAAGLQILGHDDWDCLDDLRSAGYVDILSLANSCVRMTPQGIKVAAMLREHKATGGMFAGFRLAAPSIVA